MRPVGLFNLEGEFLEFCPRHDAAGIPVNVFPYALDETHANLRMGLHGVKLETCMGLREIVARVVSSLLKLLTRCIFRDRRTHCDAKRPLGLALYRSRPNDREKTEQYV